ncbi:MAG: hypothetical protein HQ474_05200 [Flammeovirgaceae bacterium]|jgi:quinol monooxygenase YgiN|nr:hypothetical protein [Flammeovirgaceae bacterium]NQW27288.1 hypothetical protein [Flammeovirgaceae bacterium]
MIQKEELMPAYLSQPTKIGEEISITGKWVPKGKGGLFGKSKEANIMMKEWKIILELSKNEPAILSTEINLGVGEDAILIHQVFSNAETLIHFFTTTAKEQYGILHYFANPELHLVRGTELSEAVKETLLAQNIPVSFGSFLFGYVKEDYQPPLATSIQVTAKWTCKSNDPKQLEAQKHWWQQVGTDAYDLEKGLLRFEVFQAIGENALIIHETFIDSDQLQFHLAKGTADRYKKRLDKISVPDKYFFRGSVSWLIRTYSRILRLPATYSTKGPHFTRQGGSMSDGKS